MASGSAGTLTLDPPEALTFVLSENEATSKVQMTLTHPGDQTAAHIAFKVRAACSRQIARRNSTETD